MNDNRDPRQQIRAIVLIVAGMAALLLFLLLIGE